jgi:hypothetical protein
VGAETGRVGEEYTLGATATGHVYFILSPINGMVKVGYTADHPDLRLRRLRATCPVPLEPMGLLDGGMNVERQIHHRFAHLHSHGEWFAADADMEAFIRANAGPWAPRPLRFKRPLPRVAVDRPTRQFKRPVPVAPPQPPPPAPAPRRFSRKHATVLDWLDDMRRQRIAAGIPSGWTLPEDQWPRSGEMVDWMAHDGGFIEGGVYLKGQRWVHNGLEILYVPVCWRPTTR